VREETMNEVAGVALVSLSVAIVLALAGIAAAVLLIL
jgi:hypothetical protein